MRLTAGILIPDVGLEFVTMIESHEADLWFEYAAGIVNCGARLIIRGEPRKMEGAMPIVLYDAQAHALLSQLTKGPTKMLP